ncbi:CRISPR-associated protein Cas5 subtype I-C [Lactobacillus colini]|uniref:CRISPR-associated protein Cas5 subtype I-C n=1 Tax=Lactobacillus colini TaxID=1819254 RepID=A0ABS4MI10_9LACO|nr:CRISPR-associated protein Cas5 subtype I-C [Lactobacillus colini]
MKRCIERGGRRDTFLGTRDAEGYIEPCNFGEGKGYYDDAPDQNFGTMVHGLDYPDETGRNMLGVRLWHPVMHKGVINFIRPGECPVRRDLHELKTKNFGSNNFTNVDELYSELFGGE